MTADSRLRDGPPVNGAFGLRAGEASSAPRIVLGAVALAGVIAVLPAVPAAGAPWGAGNAVISVMVGGDREGSAVRGVQGVRLRLYGSGTPSTADGQQGEVGESYDPRWRWVTCVSDAAGECTFEIPVRDGGQPDATGVEPDTRFWVVQDGDAPQGWYANPAVRLGDASATRASSWEYRFRTFRELRPGTVYRSTGTFGPTGATFSDWDEADPDTGFMRAVPEPGASPRPAYAGTVSRTTGLWSQSRRNPKLSAGCELDVAVLTDLSGSLGVSGVASARAAMDDFIDALRGTPARVASFSFSSGSPATGGSNHPDLLPVATPSQARAAKARYASWAPGGATNWDAGLATVAGADADYDLVVVLTDGNPTVARDAAGDGALSSYQDLDHGIFSANALKASGTRIVAVGVGPGVASPATAANLRAISGENAGVDYVQSGDWREAVSALRGLADTSCTSSLTVTARTVEDSADVVRGMTAAQLAAVSTPARGYAVSASTSTQGVSLGSRGTRVTGAGGRTTFALSFDPSVTAGRVEVTGPGRGTEVVQVDGADAVCTSTRNGARVPVTNARGAQGPGFSVRVDRSGPVRCVVYVRPTRHSPDRARTVSVEKTAVPASGSDVVDGQEVSYLLTFRNTATSPRAVGFVDHLDGVLDDAVLVSSPALDGPGHGLSVSPLEEGAFSVTGTQAPGSVVRIRYAVRVHVTGHGDDHLLNVVTRRGGTPSSTCFARARACTTHPVRTTPPATGGAQPSDVAGDEQAHPPLPRAGGGALWMVPAAGALLVYAVRGAYWIGRRGRRHR
ncbi:MAG: vWA domain-containing protein [Nocardioides sp.]|uniref:vWA domain-containing protein n=1 Tax=Nocardioides sp. TaxID=35761 RepID=UPI003F0105C7